MAEDMAERKASTLLLALLASGSKAVAESKKSDEEQRTQSMMYAARMRYLDDSDQMTPDPLFMTRKQAQKIAQRHDTGGAVASLSLRNRLDVGGQQAGRKSNASTAATTAAGLLSAAAWKKANNLNNHRASVDERQQVWEAKCQAGCRFWQNVETGECRSVPPPSAQHVGGFPLDGLDDLDDLDDDDESLPFPDSFAFLEGPQSSDLSSARARQRCPAGCSSCRVPAPPAPAPRTRSHPHAHTHLPELSFDPPRGNSGYDEEPEPEYSLENNTDGSDSEYSESSTQPEQYQWLQQLE